MRYFRPICLCIVLVLFSSALVSSQEKTEENLPPVSLIRKDLLVHVMKKLDPIKRNIFTPNSVRTQEVDEFGEMGEEQQGDMSNIENLEAEQLSATSLDLRYIGYVKSGQKITAFDSFRRGGPGC